LSPVSQATNSLAAQEFPSFLHPILSQIYPVCTSLPIKMRMHISSLRCIIKVNPWSRLNWRDTFSVKSESLYRKGNLIDFTQVVQSVILGGSRIELKNFLIWSYTRSQVPPSEEERGVTRGMLHGPTRLAHFNKWFRTPTWPSTEKFFVARIIGDRTRMVDSTAK
jgi:hypothetical protein